MAITRGWKGVAAMLALAAFAGLCACAGQRVEPVPRALLDRHDQALEQEVVYTITRDPGGALQLSSEVSVRIACLSDRQANQRRYGVVEPYYASVEGLVAELDGRAIPRDQIDAFVPERRDVFLSDLKLHSIHFKGLRKGQVLAYRYRQRFRELAFFPIVAVPDTDFVRRFTVTVRHPPELSAEFELAFPRRRFQPKIVRGSRESSLTFSDLSRQGELSYFAEDGIAVLIRPRVTAGGKPVHPVEPEDFARWYFGFWGAPAPLAASVRSFLEQLTAGLSTPRDKLRAIYDFARKQVRYIADERGLEGIVPRRPAQVIERRYGDCKDKARLVVELARQLGIEADPVLVGVTVPERALAGVHVSFYDHMIVAHRDGDRLVFLDPTCRDCEYGTLPNADVDRPALLLARGGARRLRLPAPEAKEELAIELLASTAALSLARARILLRGGARARALHLQRTERGQALQTGLSSLIGAKLFRVELSGFGFGRSGEGELELTATADLSQLLVRSARRIYLPKVPFALIAADLLGRKADAFPIELDYRDHMSLRLVLESPGYTPGPEAPLVLGAPGLARFETQLDRADDRVVFAYSFREWRRIYEGKARAEYLAFAEAYLGARSRMYVLEGGEGR